MRPGPPARCPAHSTYAPGCAGCARQHKRWQTAYRASGRTPRLVDGTATARRLRGLAVTGWPASVLGARAGVHPRQVQAIQAGTTVRVARVTEEAVAAVYARLAGTPGPGRRTATNARLRGWVHPDRWDGLDLADPDAVPHPPEVEAPRLPRVDIDDVAHLVEAGASWPEVARRLGVTATTVEKACARAGRRDLIPLLTAQSGGHHARWWVDTVGAAS